MKKINEMKLFFKIIFLSLYIHVDFLQTCPNDLPLTGQINSGNFIANRTLNSGAINSPNSSVELKVGTAITQESGCSTGENVDFLATIESCSNDSSTRNNTLTWSSFPSSVTSGATYTIDLVYTLTQPGLIHLILADENWTKIGEAYTTHLAAGTRIQSLTFTLTGPPSPTTNYLQARLLNTKWEDIGVANLTEVLPAGNTLENNISWNNITNLPNTITAGASYNIAIDYALTIPGLVYLQLMNANFEKVGEVWTNGILEIGSGTETLTLPVNNDASSSVYYIQAQLFDANWRSVGANPIQEEVTGNSNCPSFGLQHTSDPPLTEYRTISPNPPNKNLQDIEQTNTLYGYHSNWYVSDTWRGPIKAFWGDVTSTSGYNFWMEWENTQQPINGVIPHGEFDVRVQKHIWSYDHDRFGYPKRIAFLPDHLNCTAIGQWAPCSSGRGHINLTAWISTDSTSNFDSDLTQERCDIIIHAWDNSGNISAHEGWEIIGSPTTGGITYDIIQRSGDLGEKASFNIVPRINGLPLGHPNRRPITGEYPDTSPMSFNIDVKFFIDWLMENAVGADGNPIFDETWHLIGCEWTITPQSAGVVDGVSIPASKGRWTFIEYLIANLNSSSLENNIEPLSATRISESSTITNEIEPIAVPILHDASSIYDSLEQQQVSIYPNPFSNSITVLQSVLPAADITTLLLFDVTGQQLQSFILKEVNQQVPTSHLGRGLYSYQVINARGQMIANGKIVKR